MSPYGKIIRLIFFVFNAKPDALVLECLDILNGGCAGLGISDSMGAR
jgi:hypothetical protein